MRPHAIEPPAASDEIGHLRAEIERLRARLEAVSQEARTLRALADEDPLTGLLNRRGFGRDLARAISFAGRYRTPAALLLVDLDRFKPINDLHGHEAGDAALRHAADLLRANLRASDLLGRLGGDEFALLLWQIEPEAARGKADSLEAILADSPLSWRGRRLPVSASVGSAVIAAGDDVASALARADAAMYARKAERRAALRRPRGALRR